MWGKLIWWHNHIWSSEETWIRAAIVSHFKLGIDVVSPPTLADYDRWVTHIANTFQAEDSEFGEGYGVRASLVRVVECLVWLTWRSTVHRTMRRRP